MSEEAVDLNTSQFQSAVRKKEYKHLLEVGGQAAENVDTNSVVDNLQALKKLLIKSNELIGQGTLTDRIGQSAEVVLDAQVCKLASDLMGTTVQKIENDDFSDADFAAALIEHVTDDSDVRDWSKLDPMVAEMANTFIFMPSMFGTFDFEDVAAGTQDNQKQRRTRKKAETAVEKRPISVTQSGDTETGCAKVEQVLKIIKNVYRKNGGKPIPYYQLVIDPTNMMYTFDNTFQVSFLFRDGCIAFVNDDEGMISIKPIEENEKPEKPAEMTSLTSSLNHTLIQKFIKKYNIREPMLKISRE